MTTPDPGARALELMDELIAVGQRIADDLRAILAEIAPPQPKVSALRKDPMRTPATIAGLVDVGRSDDRYPWVRFPGSPRWRQIVTYAPPNREAGRREWALHFIGPDGIVVELVESYTTLPAYSADEFDKACAEEQAA